MCVCVCVCVCVASGGPSWILVFASDTFPHQHPPRGPLSIVSYPTHFYHWVCRSHFSDPPNSLLLPTFPHAYNTSSVGNMQRREQRRALLSHPRPALDVARHITHLLQFLRHGSRCTPRQPVPRRRKVHILRRLQQPRRERQAMRLCMARREMPATVPQQYIR